MWQNLTSVKTKILTAAWNPSTNFDICSNTVFEVVKMNRVRNSIQNSIMIVLMPDWLIDVITRYHRFTYYQFNLRIKLYVLSSSVGRSYILHIVFWTTGVGSNPTRSINFFLRFLYFCVQF